MADGQITCLAPSNKEGHEAARRSSHSPMWFLVAIAGAALVGTKLVVIRADRVTRCAFEKRRALTDQLFGQFSLEYNEWLQQRMKDAAHWDDPNRPHGGGSSGNCDGYSYPDFYSRFQIAFEDYAAERRTAFTFRVTWEAHFLSVHPVAIEIGPGYRTEEFVTRITQAYAAEGISYRLIDVRGAPVELQELTNRPASRGSLLSGLAAMNVLAGMASILGAIVSVVVPMVRQWPRQGTTPYCRPCGYNLTGLTTPRCPECGSTVTPATTVRGSRRITPEFWAARVAWTVAWVVGYWAWKSIWW